MRQFCFIDVCGETDMDGNWHYSSCLRGWDVYEGEWDNECSSLYFRDEYSRDEVEIPCDNVYEHIAFACSTKLNCYVMRINEEIE